MPPSKLPGFTQYEGRVIEKESGFASIQRAKGEN